MTIDMRKLMYRLVRDGVEHGLAAAQSIAADPEHKAKADDPEFIPTVLAYAVMESLAQVIDMDGAVQLDLPEAQTQSGQESEGQGQV